jgi:hypothetical protein
MSLFQEIRRDRVSDLLRDRGRNNAQISQIMDDINGPITSDSISRALRRSGMSRVEREEFIGQFRQLDTVNTQAGLGVTSREADRMFNAVYARNERDRLQQQAGFRVDLHNLTDGQGTVGGLRALSRAFRDPARMSSMSNFMSTILGDVDVDLSSLSNDIDGLLEATEGEGLSNQTARAGLSRAYQALLTGRIGNRQATSEELQRAKKIISGRNNPKRAEMLSQFLTDVDDAAVNELRREHTRGTLHQKLYGGKNIDAETSLDLDKRAALVERSKDIAGYDDFKSIQGDEKEGEEFASARSKADTLRNVAKRRAEFLSDNEGSVKETLANFWKGESAMKEEEFNNAMRKESLARERISEGGAMETNDILSQILQLLVGAIG